MSNGEVNCILQVCCPAGSVQAVDALAAHLAGAIGCAEAEARPYAQCVIEHFDLAEKGTLAPLKASIARLARGPRSHRMDGAVEGADPAE